MKTPSSGGRPPSSSKTRSGGPARSGDRSFKDTRGGEGRGQHGKPAHGADHGHAAAKHGGPRPDGGRAAGPRDGAKPAGGKPFAAPRPDHGGPRPDGGRAAGARDGAKPAAARPFVAPRPDHGGTLQAKPVPAAPRPRPSAPAQPQRPQAPAGTIWLYGIHPVAAALANPNRRLRRLLITEEAEANLAEQLKGPYSVQPERTERSRIDHLLGHDAVHQGVALLADPLPQPALAQVLERPGPLLILDQVTDPRNVGAILRSAAAFGVACVITQDRNAPEETGALAKAASGALETIPLLRAVNLARTLVALKAAGLWTVGLAADAPALRGTAMANRRIALVLGAEGPGMRRLTRETCDELAGLAMPGSMESLNVSAAATVALYELTRS